MGYLVKVKLAFIQPEHVAMEGAANGDEAAVAHVSMVVEGEKMIVQYFYLHTKHLTLRENLRSRFQVHHILDRCVPQHCHQ